MPLRVPRRRAARRALPAVERSGPVKWVVRSPDNGARPGCGINLWAGETLRLRPPDSNQPDIEWVADVRKARHWPTLEDAIAFVLAYDDSGELLVEEYLEDSCNAI